jgi:hypothetical protein
VYVDELTFFNINEEYLPGETFMHPYDKVVSFFGGAFDSANDQLFPFGVQLIMRVENMVLRDEFLYDEYNDVCWEGSPIDTRTTIIDGELGPEELDGIANRIIILSCPNVISPGASKVSSQTAGDCSNTSGLLYDGPEITAQRLIKELARMISRGVFEKNNVLHPTFNRFLCEYVDRCVINTDHPVGGF